MQKKFITNLAFLIIINLLVKPFWILGIDRAVQNTVDSNGYGLYYALLNFSLLLNITLDLGITNFNNRNISQNMHLVHKHLSGIIVLRLLLAAFYLVLSVSIALIIGYKSLELQMLLMLLFNQVMLSFILYLRSNISGLHYFKTDSVISVLDRLIMIAICGALLLYRKDEFHNHIEWYVYSQTAGYLITVCITLWVLHGKISMQRLNWNPAFFMLILKKSAPFAVLIFLMSFYNFFASIMIERMLPDGAEQSGIFAQANRLLDASNMIAFLFGGLLLPLFAHLIKKKQSVEELTKLSYCLISVPAILLISSCMFYKYEIMNLLYKHHEVESGRVLGILVFCFFAMSSNYIFGTLLTANGSLKQMNIMALSAVVINILLNLYLIPRYKAVGAAYASVTTQFFTALVQIVLSHRIFNFKIDYKLLWLFLLFSFLTIAFTYMSRYTNVYWLNALIIAMGASMLAAFALRLINLKVIAEIMKREE
ncbi:MAG: polysaccharide biosynthesis C-terminal domain-containing protein [Bacteroidia bacterium]